MNWILEPIGYSCIGDSQKCFLGVRAKTIAFDELLEEKKKKKRKEIQNKKVDCMTKKEKKNF